MNVDIHLRLSDFARRTTCPACHSPRASLVSSDTTFTRFEQFPSGSVALGEDVKDARRLLLCDACGLWYFCLVPTSATIGHLLDQPGLPSRWSACDDRGTFDRAHSALARYRSKCGNILDVGAHAGGFLSTLPQGWIKTALEPMARSSEEIVGTTVLRAFLEDAGLAPASFDCVTAFDILEHLQDPELGMGRIADALKPGGLLLLETGTSDAPIAKRLRAGWYYLNHLEHLQAFNMDSLTNLLERTGFRVLEANRVFHKSFPLRTKVRSLVHLTLFTCMTRVGQRSSVWLAATKLIEPTAQAAPPYTMTLEPDHIFLVAQKT